jgi:hypothetical protein
LIDITYLNLEEAYQKYIVENCNTYPSPFNHMKVVHLSLLKSRIISQTKYSKYQSIEERGESKEDIKDIYFSKHCLNTISEEEKNYLDNTMYLDDHLIDWVLASDLTLREKAMTIIKDSPVGSWIVRRSSIKEQEHVKIRVITCKVMDESIKNYLIAHINGFGYVITIGLQGSSMPRLGENKTIKINDNSFYSLPALLDYIKLTQGIDLNMLIKDIY